MVVGPTQLRDTVTKMLQAHAFFVIQLFKKSIPVIGALAG